MDTLPLNGNFNNSYSLRNGGYGDSVQVVDCGLSLDDAAFEKMIISELVHNNLRAKSQQQQQQQQQQPPPLQHHPVNLPHQPHQPPPHQPPPHLQPPHLQPPHQPPPHFQPPHLQAHHHYHTTERAPPKVTVVGGSCSQDDAMVADASSLVHVGDAVGLGLHHHHHHRQLEAPLIPQRTHSLLYQPQKRVKTEGTEGYVVGQLTAEADDSLQSPNRDSLYTSMPNLRDSPCPESSPDAEEEEDLTSPSKRSENEDVYYKSMPNLGAGQQLQAYYQISRGSSDGYIIPITKDGCIPEGDVREGQMQLVTSL